jgi:predicted Rossmann fold flavoprotein
MVPVFLSLAEIAPDKKVRDITRPERRRMVELMKAIPMHIKGVRGFEEAIITRGGIHVKEIDPSTMESKLLKGLYFAGEIIDVDAETGGYNLQIAWSTGYTAGVSAG